jgi:hypothetical protein
MFYKDWAESPNLSDNLLADLGITFRW